MSAEQADGGIDAVKSYVFALDCGEIAISTAQSPSQKSEISDSPLYTRGPWGATAPEQLIDKLQFSVLVALPMGELAKIFDF